MVDHNVFFSIHKKKIKTENLLFISENLELLHSDSLNAVKKFIIREKKKRKKKTCK